jgi:hypothetical protein
MEQFSYLGNGQYKFKDKIVTCPKSMSIKHFGKILNLGGVCIYCGDDRIKKLTIEHLIPKCRGGIDRRPNLGVSCAKCNHDKGPLTDAEFLYLRNEPELMKRLQHRVHFLLKRRFDTPTKKGKVRTSATLQCSFDPYIPDPEAVTLRCLYM